MKPRGRPDAKAEQARFAALGSFYALASPKLMGPIPNAAAQVSVVTESIGRAAQSVAKPVAAAPKRKDKRPLEKDVQREILRALKVHPNVAFVGRFNRGQAVEGNRRIFYNSVAGFPDIHGMTKDAKPFYFEVKRDAHGVLSVDQERFIQMIRRNGGIAGMIWDVDSMLLELIR